MLPIQFYNSKTRQKELFEPIQSGYIKLYVCGMTVYDYCHIGHARVMVAFDTLVRFLRSIGYQVTYVRNITDIDDKIILRANENLESITTLTGRFIEAMHQDAERLGVLAPDYEPRATTHISQMIAMINQLVNKGFAYVADNGDVYYDVSRFDAYGQLSGQDLEKLRSGARVAVNSDKQDPLDFVLWKLAKKGEPSWPSPWGDGRPGWHIECSAMSCELLGNHFDIHGGGSDLLFPHHENELAQSVGAHGGEFVNTWLHLGFVQVNQEKMSKSLGNFFTIREVLAHYPAEAVRYFLVASHYRSPLHFSHEALEQASQSLDRIYNALRDLDLSKAQLPADESFSERFLNALADDLNTPEAFAVFFDLVREVNRLKDQKNPAAASYGALLKSLAGVLGIAHQDPERYFQKVNASVDVAFIEKLIQERQAARQNKDWQAADAVRNQLTQMGIVLEDTAEGVKWRKI